MWAPRKSTKHEGPVEKEQRASRHTDSFATHTCDKPNSKIMQRWGETSARRKALGCSSAKMRPSDLLSGASPRHVRQPVHPRPEQRVVFLHSCQTHVGAVHRVCLVRNVARPGMLHNNKTKRHCSQAEGSWLQPRCLELGVWNSIV